MACWYSPVAVCYVVACFLCVVISNGPAKRSRRFVWKKESTLSCLQRGTLSLPLSIPPSPPLLPSLISSTPYSSFMQEVPMLEVEGHLEAFHGVDTTKIDFNKPLASQLANLPPTHTHALGPSCESQQNFTCACGKDFQFQDDLQVHQVRGRSIYMLCLEILCRFLTVTTISMSFHGW